MKRVFIIHRWAGGPNDDWRPWLKIELEKLGCEVHVPTMPETSVPNIEKWVNYLSELVIRPDKDTYFVGHSIGNQAILRYLEVLSDPVSGAIFVAGWFNLENLENEEMRRIAEPWINTPIDLRKVKLMLPKSTLIISDNDPYGAFEENKQKFSELGSKIIELHNASHITANDGYTELPEIIKEFNDMKHLEF